MWGLGYALESALLLVSGALAPLERELLIRFVSAYSRMCSGGYG